MSSILVVDDDRWYRAMVAQQLAASGYRVEEAASGADALERLESERPTLLLLDLQMPEMDGMATLARIRAGHDATELPVIMLTAHDEAEQVVSALEQGANDYVSKEQAFSVLRARVDTQRSLRKAFDRIRGLEQSLAERNERLERTNGELEATNRRMQASLAAAAQIQRTLLPTSAPKRAGARFAWRFQPCEELAGDTLNILPIGDRFAAIYVVDVVGHGVPAALLSVMVTRLLDPPGEARSPLLEAAGCPEPPAKMAARLDDQFPWDERTRQFFTLLYGVLDCHTGTLAFVSAGHPGPVRVSADGAGELMDVAGTPIGLGLEREHEDRSLHLAEGDRVYFFSDGVFEAMRDDGEQFGRHRVVETLKGERERDLQGSVDALLARIEAFTGAGGTHDDVSIVAVERTRSGLDAAGG